MQDNCTIPCTGSCTGKPNSFCTKDQFELELPDQCWKVVGDFWGGNILTHCVTLGIKMVVMGDGHKPGKHCFRVYRPRGTWIKHSRPKTWLNQASSNHFWVALGTISGVPNNNWNWHKCVTPNITMTHLGGIGYWPCVSSLSGSDVSMLGMCLGHFQLMQALWGQQAFWGQFLAV